MSSSATYVPPAAKPEGQETQSDNTFAGLAGAQKAAVLLIALGVDTASRVLKSLRDDEVEQISVQIAKMRNVSSQVVEGVLVEYRDLATAQDVIAQGGIGYAREVLESALGARRAEEIMMKVEAAMEVSAFHLLQTVETSQLTNFLQHEHPQTVALILAHLNPHKSADIVASMPAELQSEILMRLATMGKTSPEMLRDIEEVIRQQIGQVFGADLSSTGGIEKVAEILNNTSRSAERTILDSIRERDAKLATAIKGLMFVFDDLVNINDRDMQRLLMEVDQKDLALALRAASEELKTKVLKNVSERVASSIMEEMELLGQVRVRDVDEAQHRILETAQGLEDREEIVLSRVSEDVLL